MSSLKTGILVLLVIAIVIIGSWILLVQKSLPEQISEIKQRINSLEEELNNVRQQFLEIQAAQNESRLREEETLTLIQEMNSSLNQLFKMLERKPTLVSLKPVDTLSHYEVLQLLRQYFPGAEIRGVEGEKFQVTTLSQVQEFLKTMEMPQNLTQGDKVFWLIGKFSGTADWNQIPIGYIKYSDEEIFNILISQEGETLVIWKAFNCELGSRYCLEKITTPQEKVICVVIV